jgi:hypothetical protein
MKITTEEIQAMTTVDEVHAAMKQAREANRRLMIERKAWFNANDWWLERLGDRMPELRERFREVAREAEAEVERAYKERLAPTSELAERLSELHGPKTITIGGDDDED